MELPTAAAILPADGNAILLIGYLLVIAAAAFFGGSSVSFLTLGHRRLQVLLSFTGGVLLGVALLHLVPHAYLEFDRRLDTTMTWMLGLKAVGAGPRFEGSAATPAEIARTMFCGSSDCERMMIRVAGAAA